MGGRQSGERRRLGAGVTVAAVDPQFAGVVPVAEEYGLRGSEPDAVPV